MSPLWRDFGQESRKVSALSKCSVSSPFKNLSFIIFLGCLKDRHFLRKSEDFFANSGNLISFYFGTLQIVDKKRLELPRHAAFLMRLSCVFLSGGGKVRLHTGYLEHRIDTFTALTECAYVTSQN